MAFSAVCFTLAAISSIEAEASSVEAACSVEPCDSCSALAESCCEPADMLWAAPATWVATPRSLATMFSKAMPSLSLSEWRCGSTVRSPAAMESAIWAVALRLAVMAFSALIRSPSSSWLLIATVCVRSPLATASAS